MSLLRAPPRPRLLAPALLIVFRGVARAGAPPLLGREPVLVRALRPEGRAGLGFCFGGIGPTDGRRV